MISALDFYSLVAYTAPFIQLFSGLFLIILGANSLVSKATSLAANWKLSPLFIAMTVVSLGTTLPEFTVSMSSLFSQNNSLAVGNIIGSNITNLTLIFGLAILFHSPRIGTTKTQINSRLLLAITLAFVMLVYFPIPSIVKGAVAIVSLLFILYFQHELAVRGRTLEDKLSIVKLRIAKKSKKHPEPVWITLSIILLAITGLSLGGKLTVFGAERAAEMFSISSTFLGLTITSLATSLPELFTILTAVLKKQDKVAIGNLLGSSMYNLTWTGAVLLAFSSPDSLRFLEYAFLLGASLLAVGSIWIWKGIKVPAWVGVAMIAFYLVFVHQAFLSS